MMKIILIEDQNLLSTTLRKALEQVPDIEVVGQSDKASDAPDLCTRLQPDIVVMDVFTREGSGIDYTARIKQAFPKIKVLVMTGVEDDRLVEAAEEAGADMFIWKNTSLEELTEFIRYAQKDYRLFPSLNVDNGKKASFSDLDLRIVALLAQGKSAREIASELYLGYGTVRIHISHLYASTGLKSRAQLVAYAMRAGLIRLD
ncbi:MAG: response regulator transcription factor [Ruminococcaceae bacterium]|nr:response regulator transcription factor [Oscillospiraceae bacterium]